MIKYQTVVIDYTPKAKPMAKKIEECANEMLTLGMDLITFSTTQSGKAILVFKGEMKPIEVSVESNQEDNLSDEAEELK